jgi:hypothetical protein
MVPFLSPSPALAADPTTEVTITKLADDGTTIIDQVTIDYLTMESVLPVQGDGVTHYYFQGPTFDSGNMWDPDEMVNIDSRDYGAAKGTDVKDLCDLVGGASAGDVIKIKSPDGFNKNFAYEDVYNPEPEQGKIVITWYTADTAEGVSGYVPEYSTGMRLLFFAETQNPDGKYVFGIWDMHETLAEEYWHYYYDGATMWPSSSGLSVKWVSDIIIYTDEPAEEPPEGSSASLGASANILIPMVGIELDRTSIDYGAVGPGESSAVETVIVTNTGTYDVDVTLEVQGADATAQDFYEQSLYVNSSLYNIAAVIASILIGGSQPVDTQLQVPSTWSIPGAQDATYIFWAEATS